MEDDLRKAFEAGRMNGPHIIGAVDYRDGDHGSIYNNLFETFEDYLKSISQ
jgi:hypothetical protein